MLMTGMLPGNRRGVAHNGVIVSTAHRQVPGDAGLCKAGETFG
jgi:hypothetical protein